MSRALRREQRLDFDFDVVVVVDRCQSLGEGLADGTEGRDGGDGRLGRRSWAALEGTESVRDDSDDDDFVRSTKTAPAGVRTGSDSGRPSAAAGGCGCGSRDGSRSVRGVDRREGGLVLLGDSGVWHRWVRGKVTESRVVRERDGRAQRERSKSGWNHPPTEMLKKYNWDPIKNRPGANKTYLSLLTLLTFVLPGPVH